MRSRAGTLGTSDMKILFVTDRFRPEPMGGYERWLESLSTHLVARGHTVTVLTRRPDSSVPRRERIDGVDVRRYAPRPAPEKLWMFRHAISRQGVKTELRRCEGKFDVVIGAGPYLRYAARLAPSIRRLYRAAGTLLGARQWDKSETQTAGLKVRLLQNVAWRQSVLAERQAIRYAHRVAAPSANVAEQLTHYYNLPAGQVAVIPHGAEPQPLPDGRSIHTGRLNVLSVGRLHDIKNHRLAIEALAQTANRDAMRLRIVGDGTQRQALEHLAAKLDIAERVELPGHCDGVAEHYRWADLFVLPSTYEAFGIALVEAMSAALPCVALRPDPPKIWTANAEIIQDGQTGLLLKRNTPGCLAEAMDMFLRRPELARQMGLAGRLLANSRFTWANVAEQYERLFEKLTQSDSRKCA